MTKQHPSPKIRSNLQKLTVSALIWNNSHLFVASELMNFNLLSIYWIYEKNKDTKDVRSFEELQKNGENEENVWICLFFIYQWQDTVRMISHLLQFLVCLQTISGTYEQFCPMLFVIFDKIGILLQDQLFSLPPPWIRGSLI